MAILDEIDIQILSRLKDNARIKASQISQEVNLSVSSVTERIRKLEQAGIITAYTTVIDQKKIGNDVTALMEVSLDHPKFYDSFTQMVEETKSVVSCYYISGDFDFMLRVVTDNTQSLEHLLNLVKSIPGVQNTRTILILSSVKDEHSVDPDELLK